MKLPIFLTFVLSITAAHAQEVFDLFGYKVPEGYWKKSKGNDFVSLTLEDSKRGYCLIGLYKAIPSTGSAENDSKDDWNEFATKRYPEIVVLKVESAPIPNSEWMSTLKFGVVNKNDVEIGLTTVTFTGYGQHLLVLFENTHKDFDQFTPEFLAHMILYQPAQAPPVVATPDPTKQQEQTTTTTITDPSKPQSIFGDWKRSMANFANAYTGYRPSAQGYARHHYTFNEDNTYSFYMEAWSEAFAALFFLTENGSFKLDGNKLKLYPAKSVFEKRGYKEGRAVPGGPLLETKTLPLTPTQYTWSFYYWEGTQEWNLALQTDKSTDRDGEFSTSGTLEHAYYFSRK